MDYNELETFVKDNPDNHNEYFEMVIAQLEKANKEVSRITYYLAIVMMSYFFLEGFKIDKVVIGPLEFSEIEKLKVLVPSIYSFLLFQYLIKSKRGSQLTSTAKYLFAKKFNYELSDDERKNHVLTNSIPRRALPFSFWTELNGLDLGLFGLLLFLISWLLIVVFSLSFTIKSLIYQFSHLSNYLTYSVLFVNLWLMTINIYLFYLSGKVIINNYKKKENKSTE